MILGITQQLRWLMHVWGLILLPFLLQFCLGLSVTSQSCLEIVDASL